jgi:hypothetical protein
MRALAWTGVGVVGEGRIMRQEVLGVRARTAGGVVSPALRSIFDGEETLRGVLVDSWVRAGRRRSDASRAWAFRPCRPARRFASSSFATLAEDDAMAAIAAAERCRAAMRREVASRLDFSASSACGSKPKVAKAAKAVGAAGAARPVPYSITVSGVEGKEGETRVLAVESDGVIGRVGGGRKMLTAGWSSSG